LSLFLKSAGYITNAAPLEVEALIDRRANSGIPVMRDQDHVYGTADAPTTNNGDP